MKNIILTILLGFAIIGCKKGGTNHPWFDSSLVHNTTCTEDYPGFEGCDSKTYCNECIAAKNGIGPK